MSIFAGAGGMDAGLRRSGVRVEAAIDLDPVALKTVAANLEARPIRADLTARTEYRSLSGNDVLFFAPPCQGFSNLGRRDQQDPRNALLDVAVDAIVVANPMVAVIENVRNVHSRLHSPRWLAAHGRLRLAGFRTKTVDIDVRDVGLPQSRRRAILIAWRNQFAGNFAFHPVQHSSLMSVLSNLGGYNHELRELDPLSRSGRIARHIPQGGSLSNVRSSIGAVRTWDVPSVYGQTTARERAVLDAVRVLRRRERVRNFGDGDPVALERINAALGRETSKVVEALVRKNYLRHLQSGLELTHTYNGKFKRPLASGVSPTVDTRFTDANYFLHPTENRPFTVREAARIQGFEDDFQFVGSKRDQIRLVGNAVPPPVGAVIGMLVRRAL